MAGCNHDPLHPCHGQGGKAQKQIRMKQANNKEQQQETNSEVQQERSESADLWIFPSARLFMESELSSVLEAAKKLSASDQDLLLEGLLKQRLCGLEASGW